MNDLFHEVLLYLKQNDGLHNAIEINECIVRFYKSKTNEPDTLRNISIILNDLNTRKYTLGTVPYLGGRGNGFETNDLNDHVLRFSLQTDGYQYISQVEKESKQENLLERQTISIEKSFNQTALVAESQIASNNATTLLYTRTENYYRSQRNAAWVIVALTAANFILAFATFMQTCGKPRQSQAQQWPMRMQKIGKTKKVQKKIDSFLPLMGAKYSLEKRRFS